MAWRDTKTRFQGVFARHRKACRLNAGGNPKECNCTPSYYGVVWDRAAGKVRKTNQDHFLICSLRKQMQVHLTSLPDIGRLPPLENRLAFLAMVADGVGGSAAGETASRVALEAVTRYLGHSMRCTHSSRCGVLPSIRAPVVGSVHSS